LGTVFFAFPCARFFTIVIQPISEPDEYIRGSLWHCIRILGTFKAAALANASRKCVELLCTFIGVVGVQPRILSKAELKNYKETLFVLYPEAKQPKPTQ
jgi:hypothetical protein